MFVFLTLYELLAWRGHCPAFLFLSNQKQLFVAVHASDVYNLCGSDAHATTGASVFAAAALSGSHTDEGRDTVVSSGASNLKTAELVPIDKNVGQRILFNNPEDR